MEALCRFSESIDFVTIQALQVTDRDVSSRKARCRVLARDSKHVTVAAAASCCMQSVCKRTSPSDSPLGWWIRRKDRGGSKCDVSVAGDVSE